MVKNFQIKEKAWSLGGRFTITDDLGIPTYQVEGTTFAIPKTFVIKDMTGREVSRIERKLFTFLPHFTVKMADGNSFTIKKDYSFFKSHYSLDHLDLEVKGDIWNMTFELFRQGELLAQIWQEWFKLTSTYQVTVLDDSLQDLVISLVIAIDYIKEIGKPQ